MRTVFVNPTRRRSSKKRRNAAGSTSIAKLERKIETMSRELSSKPRRRARKNAAPKRRTRRRNAGIVPFVATRNPLILRNPRRKSSIRRRRNPGLGRILPAGGIKGALKKTLAIGGGAGIGLAVNAYGINQIVNPWLRNGARIAAAVLGGAFLKGELGGAFAGAVMYPTLQEVALAYVPQFPGQTVATLPALPSMGQEADLNVLAADLEAALGDADYEELSNSDIW